MTPLIAAGLSPIQAPFSQRELVQVLRTVLPHHCVLYREEDTRPYECDGLSLYRALPAVVALPETEAQVCQVLRVCKRLNVPLVARGAGTGLSGGAMPHKQGVLLGLSKLNRIKRIDPDAGVAVVEPGVRNLSISEAAAPFGLYYAPDPSSQIACSIGGNVAENAGGVHCLKYGLTVHNVLKLRVVTIDGEVVELGGDAPDAPGPELLPLFIGSEGMLGVVTEVTVKLIPKPACAQVVMASFASVEAAGNAVTQIIAAGIIPAGLEMMDRQATHMVEPFVQAGYDLDAQAILLCESDGTPEEVAHEIGRMEEVFRAAGATRSQVSESEAERLRFWAGRKNAFPAAGRVSPDYYCMDGTIPRRHLAQVLNAIEHMEDEFGLRCANVFHAGDGNLHPLILFDSNKPEEVERADKFGAAILELCVQVGGTVTGEHGVGIEKINQMCVQFSREELDAFFEVKRAFDPPGLLNPEKMIPTLARCAEYGKMHVHAGALRFPDLARF
ncbi:FAD-linked oxidase C-terminal domain-containing protein [Bordetella avium]|uniref:Glycolate oxidase subunit n=1 Tax=Bordetella avium (strain 197N) TaxID=360910 RepID=Q2KZ61_BORA1|nr:FAD-linked oxidase C-terminal domain-containing protein [Bordetella avium]AZY49460.1 FAD-binding oxidoreductase [Bordetella avium]AZY52857.1 FAD-binding oxidoreductase [Bordetella avium]RIQ12155.1 FAD-binding protein [Bordetella avium]RIQ19025.1 FAD-binding protein [Bordetella avium]RIQ31934.1 FAD-binding protein [Bordetella avium]